MRRAERIRKLRAVERDLKAARDLIHGVCDTTRTQDLVDVLPGDDPVSTFLREHVHQKAFVELNATNIYNALRAVRDVRCLMDGKP